MLILRRGVSKSFKYPVGGNVLSGNTSVSIVAAFKRFGVLDCKGMTLLSKSLILKTLLGSSLTVHMDFEVGVSIEASM